MRRQERRDVNAKVVVTWEDGAGGRFLLRGLCRNYSETGAGLVLPEPVPVHALAGIEIPELGLKAMATIRYCRRGPKGFYVGVSAVTGTGWRRTPRG